MSVSTRCAYVSPGVVIGEDPYLRSSLQHRSEGLISQTFPRFGMTAGAVLVGGTAYYSSIPLLAGDVVSSVVFLVSVAGVAMTLSKAGLYDTAGNRLATSVDQGASWETAGHKSVAMVTPYVVPASGIYYFAIIGAGGTLPIIPRAALAGNVTSQAALAPGALICGTETGKTDLDPTATITASASAMYHWAGVK